MIIDLKKEQMSISEALFIAKPHDTIVLDDIIYYEKIVVDKPFIKMVGKPNTTIYQYRNRQKYLYADLLQQ